MAELLQDNPLRDKVAIITGTARGIGRSTARACLEAGAYVAGSYLSPNSQKYQNELLDRFGNHFLSVQADVTTPKGREAHIAAALHAFSPHEGIDVLVLNAAGGLEKDKPLGWAEEINYRSQIALVDRVLPHMNKGGKIVLNASHWSHGFGDVRMLPYYREVARTKHKAEKALMGRIPEFYDRGITFSVVSSPIVRETGAHTIFEHISRQRLAELEEKMGGFPDADEVGRAIRDHILTPHETGSIHFVRGYNVEPIPPEHVGVQRLHRAQIEEALPMYDNSVVRRVLMDNYQSSEDRMSGTGWYTVQDIDAIGHMTASYGGPILPAHVRAEIGSQALGMTFKALEPDAQGLGTLDGFRIDTTGHGKGGYIFPGETIESRATITGIRGATGLEGRVEMFVDGIERTTLEDVKIGLIPDKELAGKVINRYRRHSELRRAKETP